MVFLYFFCSVYHFTFIFGKVHFRVATFSMSLSLALLLIFSFLTLSLIVSSGMNLFIHFSITRDLVAVFWVDITVSAPS